ncbi:glucuronate isomerase [Anaerovorax sp. IOR16]|uniref:glucuronate isomerase n=1 Tax=Anaerovorax sp. IOR16 TaxID=2773458 RepID=UPI0019D10C67|nr:glucuronate isomerase [Anaerovorax sp. IOR16]
MKAFIDENFLLSNKTAQNLYHEFAKEMPIVDYHCHIDPRDISENRCYENITQLWLYGDHYKWRLMRSNGIDEHYITGEASDKEKFQKYAKTMEAAIGNPLYHWSHLELKRYFDYHGTINEKNAEEIWNHCNQIIKEKGINTRSLILNSNVKLLCTTDDPIDDLNHHDYLKADSSFSVPVLPAWRPDKVVNIEHSDFVDYIKKLAAKSNCSIYTFQDLTEALSQRMDYFNARSCKISDHGLANCKYISASRQEVEDIFTKKLEGKVISEIEASKYKTELMYFFGKEYQKRDWVMQLHFGAKRDNNTKMYQYLGSDTGYDCIGEKVDFAAVTDFLNVLALTNQLPKTIIYSLDPNDNAVIDSILGCFQTADIKGKMQHGSAWWFNDHKTGMENQLKSLANLSLLGNFIGMTTDSRSFLSYVRHEYFRRILCNLIGTWVENGEYPNDPKALGKIVKNISYNNCVDYFGFHI